MIEARSNKEEKKNKENNNTGALKPLQQVQVHHKSFVSVNIVCLARTIQNVCSQLAADSERSKIGCASKSVAISVLLLLQAHTHEKTSSMSVDNTRTIYYK